MYRPPRFGSDLERELSVIGRRSIMAASAFAMVKEVGRAREQDPVWKRVRQLRRSPGKRGGRRMAAQAWRAVPAKESKCAGSASGAALAVDVLADSGLSSTLSEGYPEGVCLNAISEPVPVVCETQPFGSI